MEDTPGGTEPAVPSIPPDVSATPSPPEPRKRRFAPWLLGFLGGVLAVIVVSTVLVQLAEKDGSGGVLLRESFSSGSAEFSTDSDRLVDLSVADGMYRILIKDASAPQLIRHLWERSYDGFRFEATITQVAGPEEEVLSSVGCWAGNSAYLLIMAPSGEVGILETISESTGERRLLTDLIQADAARPRGEPNRLRIDCVGGGIEPTIVSGWVNGEPVVTLSVPDGYDSFNGVGFWIASETDGAEFRVDDVVAAAERPAPAMSPVPPVES